MKTKRVRSVAVGLLFVFASLLPRATLAATPSSISGVDLATVIGDSMGTAGGFGSATAWQTGFGPLIRNKLVGGAVVPPGTTGALGVSSFLRRLPQFLSNNSVAGRKVGDVSATFGTLITNRQTTIVVIQLGINDATAATTLATFDSQVDATLVAAVAPSYVREVWWIGPATAPGAAAAAATYDAHIQARIAANGSTKLKYIQLNTLDWSSGTVDGIHFNAFGAGQCGAKMMTDLGL